MSTIFTALAQAAGLLAVVSLATRRVDRLLRRLRVIARYRKVCILAAGVTPIALRLALLPLNPPPEPAVHDEFSYLLGADTFASGRLVNPPHPMRPHFETFHVEMEPAYVSRYLPGQAALLGLGQALFGHPWAGVLIGVAFMGSAISWALFGWLPSRWALLGTILAVTHFSLFTYWTESYWGGALPAAAGALVIGAYPRLLRNIAQNGACSAGPIRMFLSCWSRAPRPFALLRKPGVIDSLLLGSGLALLANTRPYEGIALSAPVCVGLLAWAWRKRRFRWIIPAGTVLAASLLFLAYYNYKATGDMVRLPYRAHEERYAVAPVFMFAGLRPVPQYTDDRFRRYWAEWDLGVYHAVRSDAALFIGWKIVRGAQYYVRDWPQLAVVLTLPLLLFWKRARVPILISACTTVGLLLEKVVLPHYASPATFLVILLSVLALFALSRSGPTGKLLTRTIVAGWLGLFLWQCFGPRRTSHELYTEFPSQRREILRKLDAEAGQHLVLVRYTPDHNIHHEWIYNAADIDRSCIVWARSRGGAEDTRLLEYYPERTVWTLDPDLPSTPLHPIREPLNRPRRDCSPEQLSLGVRLASTLAWLNSK
jgi:hypothetical protein